MFAALLDTCVLWPSLQRDVILSFAVEGLYRPLWSDAILEELEYHEAAKLRDRGEADAAASLRARGLVSQMRAVFDDACVTGWQGLDGTFGLADPDDEHVVAAAVVGGAGAIVTDNLRDLRVPAVPAHIHVLTAAEFASDTVSVDPARAFRAITAVSERFRHPAMSVESIFGQLVSRYRWLDAVEMLRDV
ncbi:PIN domain-containing protein [Cellulomonas sp. S1-8]|uniref:PIN domain-containing protein n=1 Tax=Cellulomonas sp. S1-8 TaxID=2904790 RepID=UPI002244F2D3|nr:PIN domain-containing protein [Cellulomonas sp. S1-8]UZN02694.1 PIN domain-containing protein [Cellulomonas sp. S1-8]